MLFARPIELQVNRDLAAIIIKYKSRRYIEIIIIIIIPYNYPRIEAPAIISFWASISFRALFDTASKRGWPLYGPASIYARIYIALAAASVEFFSTQFTAKALKRHRIIIALSLEHKWKPV